MTDLAISWINGQPDLVFADGDLVVDDSLIPPVLVSLFTDRLASAGDIIPDGTTNRRGYWADTYNADGSLTGSRIWLFSREPDLSSLLSVVEGYDEEALQWMVDAGLVQAVNVTASMPARNELLHSVQIVESATNTYLVPVPQPLVSLT
jgi:phage gp46-like protein